AVAHDEVSELSFGRLDRVIRFAGRRFDQPRDLAHDWSFGQTFGRLPDDAQRLPELFDPDKVPVVRVAGGANRHAYVPFILRAVRFSLPDVTRHARPAQRGAAHPEGNRLRARDDSDPFRPLEPDAVVRQQRLVLVDLRIHDPAELEDFLVPARRDFERQTANP